MDINELNHIKVQVDTFPSSKRLLPNATVWHPAVVQRPLILIMTTCSPPSNMVFVFFPRLFQHLFWGRRNTVSKRLYSGGTFFVFLPYLSLTFEERSNRWSGARHHCQCSLAIDLFFQSLIYGKHQNLEDPCNNVFVYIYMHVCKLQICVYIYNLYLDTVYIYISPIHNLVNEEKHRGGWLARLFCQHHVM